MNMTRPKGTLNAATPALRAEILRRARAGELQRDIARAVGLGGSRVSQICREGGIRRYEPERADKTYVQPYHEPGPLKPWESWARFGCTDAMRARLRRAGTRTAEEKLI
jgi:hypothetical protein